MKGREMYVLFAVTDLFWGYVNPPRGKSLCAPLSFLHILSLQAVSDAPITSTTFERLSDESCTVSSDNEQQPMRIRKEAIVSMIFQLIRNHLVVRNSQKEKKSGVEIEQHFFALNPLVLFAEQTIRAVRFSPTHPSSTCFS